MIDFVLVGVWFVFVLVAVSFILGLVGLYCAYGTWKWSSQIVHDPDSGFQESASRSIFYSAIGVICIVLVLLLNQTSSLFMALSLVINLFNLAVCKFAFEKRDRLQKEENKRKAKQKIREEKDRRFVRTTFAGRFPDEMGYIAQCRICLCRVCNGRINKGDECWHSFEKPEVDLCLACYEYVFAEMVAGSRQ